MSYKADAYGISRVLAALGVGQNSSSEMLVSSVWRALNLYGHVVQAWDERQGTVSPTPVALASSSSAAAKHAAKPTREAGSEGQSHTEGDAVDLAVEWPLPR